MNTEQLIEWIRERHSQYCHRQLLLIAGNESWVESRISTILFTTQADNRHNSSLFVSDSLAPKLHDITTSTIAQYKQHLGKEFDVLIYNALDGVKPSAVLALEGTVKKGGLFIILCPALIDWPAYEAKQTGISFSFMECHQHSYFIERLIALCKADDKVAIYEENKEEIKQPIPLAILPEHNYEKEKALFTQLVEQQEESRERIKQSFTTTEQNKRSKCVLITAKRGRGKSTLLGLSAFDLYMQNSNAQIYITAPAKRNCEKAISSFTNAKTGLLKGNSDMGSIIAEKNLNFIPYDQLHTLAESSIVFIDEAASMAPKVVINACTRFSKVLLASTNEGYEGSGLGFTLKVLPTLRSLSANFQQIELSTPFRYYEEDSLEHLFESIFVPRCVTNATPLMQHVSADDLDFVCIEGTDLAKNEGLLKQVFTELLQSHYQTTPDDLMRLMDSSDHFTVLAFTADKEELLGVASVIEEGQISEQWLSEEIILNGRRRLKGHLVAQNLATSFVESPFMRIPTWRIARIAVNPECRIRGIGSALLSYIKTLAEAEHLSKRPQALTSSFGYKPELYRFWTQNDYQFIKAGARTDTSSGERSLILMLPLSKQMKMISTNLHLSILCNLSYLRDILQADDDFIDNLCELADSNASSKSDQSAMVALQRIKSILTLYIQHQRPFSLCCEAIASIILLHKEGHLLNRVFCAHISENSMTKQGFNVNPVTLSILENAFIRHHQRDVAKIEKETLQCDMRAALAEMLTS